MAFADFFRRDPGLDPEERRRRRMGGFAAVAQAMSDPRYHQAGMLGPMLLAGGGAALGSRRYEQDAYQQKLEREAEEARLEEERQREREWQNQRREWAEQQRKWAEEDRARAADERARQEQIKAEEDAKIRAAGYDPNDPIEVKIYQEMQLAERGPKDPMQDVRRRYMEAQIGQMQGRGDEEPTIYRSGSGYGTITPDESGDLRYRPIPGVPEPPSRDEDPTNWILRRVAQILEPPEDPVARASWQPRSFQEAADQATQEWETIQRSIRRRRQPEPGSDVAGITVPEPDEAVPGSRGKIRFGTGAGIQQQDTLRVPGMGGPVSDPQVERIVSSLPPELQDAVRQRIQDALTSGESVSAILAELRAAMGGGGL